MLNDELKARLRRLALGATPGPRVLSPRDIGADAALEQGEDPIEVAARYPENFLGWEVEDGSGFTAPGRGDFTGADAAFLMATTPEVILALLDEIEKLKEENAQAN